MSLGGVEGTWVRYWDESATVAVLEFQVDEAVQSAPAGSKDKDKDKEKKKRLKSTCPFSLFFFTSSIFTHYYGQGSAKEGPATPSALPVSDKPVTLSFSKGPVKLNAGQFSITLNAFS
jgi:hypothetical protein